MCNWCSKSSIVFTQVKSIFNLYFTYQFIIWKWFSSFDNTVGSLNKLSRRFLWLSSNFNNDWPIRVSAKACEWPAVAWGSSSLNQCMTHNKCSWCLSCNLSPSLRKFLVPLVRASFLSDKCGNVLQYHSWAFPSKTTQGDLSIHEFWNIVVRLSLSYLRSLFLEFQD